MHKLVNKQKVVKKEIEDNEDKIMSIQQKSLQENRFDDLWYSQRPPESVGAKK